MEVCKLLLKCLKDKNPSSNNGNTPLHLAASHFEICKLFLQCDIEINQREIEMLMKNVCMELRIMVCDTVLENNSSVKNRQTLLYVAAENGDSEIFKLIWEADGSGSKISRFNGKTAFHIAAMRGHIEICKYLLNCLNNKNPCNKARQTPLYFAAKKNHFEICKLFLHYDIEINQMEMKMLKKKGQMELINLFNETSAARR